MKLTYKFAVYLYTVIIGTLLLYVLKPFHSSQSIEVQEMIEMKTVESGIKNWSHHLLQQIIKSSKVKLIQDIRLYRWQCEKPAQRNKDSKTNEKTDFLINPSPKRLVNNKLRGKSLVNRRSPAKRGSRLGRGGGHREVNGEHMSTSSEVQLGRSGRKLILVLTTMRSGSSYFSKILTMNSYTNYLFEPLILLSNKPKEMKHNWSVISNLFTSLIKCKYTKVIRDLNLDITNKVDASLIKIVFLRNYELRLKQVNLNSIIKAQRDCSRVGSVLVIKVIRIMASEISSVLNLLNSKTLLDMDPWILYLIRDPRGVMNSRRKIISNETKGMSSYNKMVSREYCDILKSTIEQILLNSPENRTLLVRYEDFAMQTESMTRCMFNKIGMAYTNSTHTYIKASSQNKNMGAVMTIIKTLAQEPYYYSTYRVNSTQTAENWRSSANISDILTLQSIDSCREMLTTYDYKLVKDEAELKKRSISFVL